MGYKVTLDIFEGPLDLLLYLIKKNEVDIYDIPIALITEQYLEYLELMKVLNLDVAGELLPGPFILIVVARNRHKEDFGHRARVRHGAKGTATIGHHPSMAQNLVTVESV